MLETIKNNLPNFPDEVISLWLEPFAFDLGWPPVHPRWKYILGEPIDFWKCTNWRKIRAPFSSIELTPLSSKAINEMVEGFYLGVENNYKIGMFNSGEDKWRYGRIFQYLLQDGSLPNPIVLLERGSQYDILDGSRRYLARMRIDFLYRELETVSEDRKNILFKKLGITRIAPLSLEEDFWVACIESEKDD